MKWIEIKIITTEEASDAVSEMLTSVGASGVAIEDPNEIRRQLNSPDSLDYADADFMNSLVEDVTIKAYFLSDSSGEGIVDIIREKLAFISRFLDTGKGYFGMTEVDDEDWATAWKKYYKPFSISENMVIKPSWEEYTPNAGETVIVLDPGMAFGTGTHETTRLCAQMLGKYIKSGDSVIDLGCGSGILSIISVKLGAEHVLAADIDETAVRVTRRNCEINGVEDKVTAVCSVLDGLVKQKAEIIVANIIADVIVGISSEVSNHIRPDGFLITSGIIKERKDEVINVYSSQGFVLTEYMELGEWVAIVFKCQDSLQTADMLTGMPAS
ncbi:MAG: 50S ribosomal protein L11 methyltransferase [Ruminiclostridium sp.]|nr:50S ribosomal protein L11 methyltransferase [Ruminiclostridium sp.]